MPSAFGVGVTIFGGDAGAVGDAVGPVVEIG